MWLLHSTRWNWPNCPKIKQFLTLPMRMTILKRRTKKKKSGDVERGHYWRYVSVQNSTLKLTFSWKWKTQWPCWTSTAIDYLATHLPSYQFWRRPYSYPMANLSLHSFYQTTPIYVVLFKVISLECRIVLERYFYWIWQYIMSAKSHLHAIQTVYDIWYKACSHVVTF